MTEEGPITSPQRQSSLYTKLNLHWFGSSLYVTFGKGILGTIGGIVGFVSSVRQSDGHVTTKHVLDFSLNVVPSCCLSYFGWQMALLQAPLNFRALELKKQQIRRAYPSLLTITGRGRLFFAAGAMPVLLMPFRSLAEAIGGCLEKPESSKLSYFLQAIPCSICNSYLVGVGFFTMLLGFIKSRKLEKLRVTLAITIENGKGPELYQHFAKMSEHGLCMAEFNDMSMQLKGIMWDRMDLKWIFSALAKESPDHVSYAELENWAKKSMIHL